jgi:hypothetical protein
VENFEIKSDCHKVETSALAKKRPELLPAFKSHSVLRLKNAASQPPKFLCHQPLRCGAGV